MSEPINVTDLINDNVKVNAAAKAALVAFRRAKPWRGTFDERLAKFAALRDAMAEAYGIRDLGMEFIGTENTAGHSNGGYSPPQHSIILIGKLSVVTFLHVFCRARGMTAKESFRWSLSVFKRFFPLSFSRCQASGPFLVRAS